MLIKGTALVWCDDHEMRNRVLTQKHSACIPHDIQEG